ncbi:MAG: hypothetical protein Kow0068_18190 [Marinilabiliales bacterium]
MKTISNYNELNDVLKQKERVFLLLYKGGSEQSECAYKNVEDVSSIIQNNIVELLSADVNAVRDIHEKYNITSAPSLLEFENGVLKNVIKGCHDSKYVKNVIEEAVYVAKAKKEGKTPKRVVVYTSPTCTWCNAIKSYFRKHNIRFREVDVSKDPQAARELVKRSGQQGVPQTDINGQIVVGFDQNKLNELLEINV